MHCNKRTLTLFVFVTLVCCAKMNPISNSNADNSQSDMANDLTQNINKEVLETLVALANEVAYEDENGVENDDDLADNDHFLMSKKAPRRIFIGKKRNYDEEYPEKRQASGNRNKYYYGGKRNGQIHRIFIGKRGDIKRIFIG